MGRLTVVGSINLDLAVLADRLPRPGETVMGRHGARALGGKGANQAVSGARAGGEVRLIGALGSDAAATELLDALAGFGLATEAIRRAPGPSGYALIIVGGGDNQIVVVPGANMALAPEDIAGLDFAPGDLCMAQLEVRPVVIAEAFARARAAGALTMLNTAPAEAPAIDALLDVCDIIVANESEWSVILGRPFAVEQAGALLLEAALGGRLAGKTLLVATLGAHGVRAVSDGRLISLGSHSVDVVDTTGAGDCFCGYLGAGLVEGLSVEAALALANAAAALAVTAVGAAPSAPDRASVNAFMASVGDRR
jgi:ribokinase